MGLHKAIKEYWEKSGKKTLAILEKKIEIEELNKKLKKAKRNSKKLEQEKHFINSKSLRLIGGIFYLRKIQYYSRNIRFNSL